MEIFTKLYSSLLPYLLCIPIGYFLKEKKLIPKWIIHKPLLFVFMPILVVDHVLEASVAKLTILPIISFGLAFLMVFPATWIYKHFHELENKNLLRSSFSFFNVAFFGIPTVQALFGKEAVTTLICIYIGTALYGNIIGYIQVAKSKFGTKKSIIEVFKVPFIYVFILAVILKIMQYEPPEFVSPVVDTLGIIVSVAGMLIIGMNITNINFKKLNWNYYSKVLGIRAISAVVITAALMAAEYFLVDGLSAEERQVMALIPLFPIAANLTVFASFLESKEKESALLVLLSMALSLILVPLLAMFFN